VSQQVENEFGVTSFISGGHFVSHLFLLAFPPLFPLLAHEFHVSVTSLGVSISLIYLAQFLLQIPAGELVDRVGAKWPLVGALFVTGGSVILTGFTDSYLWFMGFVFLSGIGQVSIHPADYALLDAAGGESTEGKRFSAHTSAGFVGFAVVPVVVSSLTGLYNWHVALIAIGAIGVVYAGVLAIWLAPVHRTQLASIDSSSKADSDDAKESESGSRFGSVGLLKRPLIAGMFGFFVLNTIGISGLETYTTSIAASGFGFLTSTGNTALTAFFAVTAVFTLVGGWLADRYNVFRLIEVGLVGSALVLWVGIALGLTPVSMIVVWGVAGVGIGVALPARDRITNSLSSGSSTGASFGIVYTGLTVGGVLAPVVIGRIIESADGVVGTAAVGASFLFAAALVYVLFVYHRSHTVSGAQPSPGD